jgi:hypothetical protein
MKKLNFFLLSSYLGFSPVYWWPGVGPQILDAVKLIVIGLAVSLIWFQAILNSRLAFPKGPTGPMGLVMLLVLSFMAAFQSALTMYLYQLKDYLLPFLTLWTFVFYVNIGQEPSRVLNLATVIIGAHCVLVCTSKFLGVPDWSGPRTFVAPELWISGFGSLRTGWSCSVALFVPIALSITLQGQYGKLRRMVFGILAVAIVLSQLVVAGRTGILASFIGITWIITGGGYRRWFPVFAGIAVAALFLAGDFLYKAMRLGDVGGHVGSVKDLNKFSAHRVESDLAAWNIFLESPITGHGFHEITFGGSEIHNLWLRLAVEGGVFLPLGLAWIVWSIWSAARRSESTSGPVAEKQLPTRCYQAVILMGVVMSMFEPRILLGTFQLTAIWWATAGIAIGSLMMQSPKPRENAALPAQSINPSAGRLARRQAGC